MKNEDIEYILWLSKRLVYRYKEDQSIIDRVEKILNDWQTDHIINNKKQEYIDHHVSTMLDSLLKLDNNNIQKFLNESNLIKSHNPNESNQLFENLKFDDIFN